MAKQTRPANKVIGNSGSLQFILTDLHGRDTYGNQCAPTEEELTGMLEELSSQVKQLGAVITEVSTIKVSAQTGPGQTGNKEEEKTLLWLQPK